MAGGRADATPEACRDVDAIVYGLLRRLRDRRDDVEQALHGRSLRIQVMLTTTYTTVYRIVLTTTGHVALMTPANLVGETFRPHLVLAGSPAEVRSVLTESAQQAADRGLLLAFVEAVHVERVTALVAEELLDLLDDSGCS